MWTVSMAVGLKHQNMKYIFQMVSSFTSPYISTSLFFCNLALSLMLNSTNQSISQRDGTLLFLVVAQTTPQLPTTTAAAKPSTSLMLSIYTDY